MTHLSATGIQSRTAMHSFFFGTQIVKLGNYTDSNAFMIFARDGVLHYVNLEQMTDYVGETFSQCNSTNVKTMELGDDYWLTLPYHEKQITLYRRAARRCFSMKRKKITAVMDIFYRWNTVNMGNPGRKG